MCTENSINLHEYSSVITPLHIKNHSIFLGNQISRWKREHFVSLADKIVIFEKILKSHQKWPKRKNIRKT